MNRQARRKHVALLPRTERRDHRRAQAITFQRALRNLLAYHGEAERALARLDAPWPLCVFSLSSHVSGVALSP